MKRLSAIGLALLTGLGACTHYQPLPIELPAVAEQQDRLELDVARAQQTCRTLAPAAPCDPQHLDRAMLYAAMLDGNPVIAAARRHLDSALAGARSARAAPGAKLTLSSEYAGAAPDPSPWLFGATSEVPLDIGGVRAVRIGSAELAVTTARYDLAEAVWTARMGMVRSMAQILIAEKQRDAATDLVGMQDRRLAAMERRVSSGEASRADLDRVRGDLADARRRRADAEARLDAGQADLATALGLPAAALVGKVFVWNDLERPAGPDVVSDHDRRAALLGRADLLKSMVAYDQAELDLRGEVAKQYPAITLGPGFTWERGLVKIPFNLGLSLPPLDLNRKAIALAEARRSEAGARLEADYAAAAGAAGAAWAEASSAFAALAELRRTDLPIATRLASQGDREFAEGAINRADWGAAKAGLLVARLQELDALARALAGEAALEDALRRPLTGPELMIGHR